MVSFLRATGLGPGLGDVGTVDGRGVCVILMFCIVGFFKIAGFGGGATGVGAWADTGEVVGVISRLISFFMGEGCRGFDILGPGPAEPAFLPEC